jgi:hypothetical protein
MSRVADTAVGPAPIVGRDPQLAALADALRQLENRRSPIVALSGEPGIGKTRLLEELCARADARGHLALRGRTAEMEQDLPFAVVVDALGDYAASLGRDRLARLVGAHVEELAPVAPGVEFGADGQGRLQDERFRTHRAVRALLEALAANAPVVLALDDVHWADEASLELIGYLLRRPPRRKVMLILAFRPGPARPVLVDALAGAVRDGAAVWLPLEPLTRAESDHLLGDELPEPARAALFAQSGGNPFYLKELARSSSTSQAGIAASDVPRRIALAIDQEVRALPGDAQRLARAAAVVGDPMALDIALPAAELEEAVALAALDALLEATLLAPSDVPRQYRFRHPLVRRAIYDTTAGGWRLGAHARAACALEEQGGSLIARAHHLERCAQPGDGAAIDVLVAAAATVAPRAPATAAAWYTAALRLLPVSVETAGARLGLLVALAQSQAATGGLMPALDALAAAMDLAGADGELAPVRARLVAGCAMLENLLGRHEAAHGRLVAALDDVADPRSAAAADLQVELAADALYDGDFTTMAMWARRGLDTAVELAEPALAVVAESLVCFAELGSGRVPEAQAAASAAAARLDRLSDEAISLRLDAPYYLGFASVGAGAVRDPDGDRPRARI